MNHQVIQTSTRRIGPGEPCYLIAEVGTTCLGNMDYALRLIDAAADAGMDAVKFQMIDPNQLSDDSVTYNFRAGGKEYEMNMKQMFSRLGFTLEEWSRLRDACAGNRIDFFATVDYEQGVDWLEALGVPLHKIGAWDVTFRLLIERIADTKKPLVVDLGPATVFEMADLISWTGEIPILFFHTQDDLEMNMRALSHLLETYPWPSGFSSPARDDDLDMLALGIGAQLIEKRLILSRNDIAFHADESHEPSELKQWVARIRHLERALGNPGILPSKTDRTIAKEAYRSVCTLEPVKAGEVFDRANLSGKRPGTGLPTAMLPDIWGRRAVKDLAENTLIREGDWQ